MRCCLALRCLCWPHLEKGLFFEVVPVPGTNCCNNRNHERPIARHRRRRRSPPIRCPRPRCPPPTSIPRRRRDRRPPADRMPQRRPRVGPSPALAYRRSRHRRHGPRPPRGVLRDGTGSSGPGFGEGTQERQQRIAAGRGADSNALRTAVAAVAILLHRDCCCCCCTRRS